MDKRIILKIIKDYPYGFTTQIKIQYPDLYDFITKQYNGRKYAEKIYQYIYDENISKCICGTKKTFISFNQGYKRYCKICRYGEERTLKSKQTKLERYGDKNYNNQKQYKQTMLERYGVEHNFANGDLREKAKETMLKKYGVKHNWKSGSFIRPVWDDKIKEKVRNSLAKTNLKKYGVPYFFMSNEFKKKYKENSLKKYGVEFPIQNTEMYERMNKSWGWKKYKLPSGKIINLQGYEPFVLDILLKSYDENEIITKKSDMPTIWYFIEGQKHRYYPDIFIKKNKKLIEVKSDYTYEKYKNINDIKHNETKKNGYLHEIWIIGREGNILNKIS